MIIAKFLKKKKNTVRVSLSIQRELDFDTTGGS